MEWLKKHYDERPEQRFINQLTFREVYERVADLARQLYLYVQNEQRVALYSPNSADMALFFLALQALEKEVLLLNTRLTAAELGKQLKALNIRVVFSHNDRFTAFQEVQQSKKTAVKLATAWNREHIAVIMHTSATTGEYKAVPLRWKQFYAHVQASRQRLGVTAADNWLMVLPMYHISGLSILMRSLYNGTQTTVVESFDEEQIINLIENGGINMLSIVPTMLSRIIHRIRQHNLRVVLVGGEFVPDALVAAGIRKNIPLHKTFGMTETTSQVATFSVAEHPGKMASVGLPLAGTAVRILNPDEQGIGEISINSPMLMDGYLGAEGHPGFFNTGDVGYSDEDGFIYIVDRRRNIIISGGENIYPREIENVLYQLPEVTECAVVGRPDKKWGQVPVLYVVSSLDEAAIYSYLAKHLASYKLPKTIIHLAELPKNAAGKIVKRKLEVLDGKQQQSDRQLKY
ncbi:o-succinylbenzoate--CoA ligase [Sporomusa termitida]|uniref:2-succinylbenzoate--CoA ligase n=1 Tax=Sporomusa termitida TaxID=2377 RepID=A0A517DRB5_9FIRM|nr:o-succinylbenzoate--CoA ligase [Sporomusa termitida]QDR79909.1 2-succinylbenzoate--CoA ligase [Sporomusa termitida]